MDSYADGVSSVHVAVLSDASRRAAYDAEVPPSHLDPANYFPAGGDICTRMARGLGFVQQYVNMMKQV